MIKLADDKKQTNIQKQHHSTTKENIIVTCFRLIPFIFSFCFVFRFFFSSRDYPCLFLYLFALVHCLFICSWLILYSFLIIMILKDLTVFYFLTTISLFVSLDTLTTSGSLHVFIKPDRYLNLCPISWRLALFGIKGSARAELMSDHVSLSLNLAWVFDPLYRGLSNSATPTLSPWAQALFLLFLFFGCFTSIIFLYLCSFALSFYCFVLPSLAFFKIFFFSS